METRRWFGLAAALVLGVLIGYGVARSTSPASRYMVGSWSDNRLYRCDTYTGRTWSKTSGSLQWTEIPQP